MLTSRLIPGPALAFTGPPLSVPRTGWHLVAIRARRQPQRWMASLRLAGPDAEAGAQDLALVSPAASGLGAGKFGIFFVRAGTLDVSARLYGASHMPGMVTLRLLRLPPALAAAGLVAQRPRSFTQALRAVAGPVATRLRKAVAAAALNGQDMPTSYAQWLRLFERPPLAPEAGREAFAGLPFRPSVEARVFPAAAGPACDATVESLAAQTYPVSTAGVADYMVLLQAGEVLAPDAILRLVQALTPETDILFADEDSIAPDGTRSAPWFKPAPSLLTMCSGLLSRGVWLVRRDLVPQGAEWAECARLEAWFALHAAGRADRSARVPRLLTLRRADAEAAPPDALARTVDAALAARGIAATAEPGFPIRLDWHASTLNAERVSILVPSRLRSEVTVGCMLDVLTRTAHRNFEMLVVVTQDAALDDAQEAAARRLEATGLARVTVLRRGAFNYSRANNFAAAQTTGAFLCLLNDDVSTLAPDWLDRMVAVLSDAECGIVGAKLYYPNLTTQHAGVIMGLGGLAQHASRFLPRGEPGYMWRGVLDQEMSVVTGACLLVRRALFDQLGGLDERLPIALNDVDFCLRAGEAGAAVVMAGSVELVHHETLSFGHHYAGEGAQEAQDVALVRRRWHAVCAADPFHNPNLSLLGQAEWEPAYPPRHADDEC